MKIESIKVGYEISEVHSNDLCCNCCYEATYGHANKVRDIKYMDKTLLQ
jgi:hypothetical protein